MSAGAVLNDRSNAVYMSAGCVLAVVAFALLGEVTWAIGVWRGAMHPSGTLPHDIPSAANRFIAAACRFDGMHYSAIARAGYRYREGRPSNVAFFPLFPLLCRCVSSLAGVSHAASAVLIANLFWAVDVALLAIYAQQRLALQGLRSIRICVAVFVLWPFGLFFHMGYSESLFVFFCLLLLIGLEANWPQWLLAIIVGAATATRPVGVALVAALAAATWRRSRGSVWRHLQWGSTIAISCSGIVLYAVYCHAAFDDALAFAKTQAYWRIVPFNNIADRIIAMAAFEPVWATYIPGTPYYWGYHDPNLAWYQSFHFVNPIVFCACCVAVVAGAWRGFFTRAECVMCVGLLAIPYVTKGVDMAMASQARFGIVVVPAYLLLGRGLSAWPAWAVSAVLAAEVALLGMYSELFAAGYKIY